MKGSMNMSYDSSNLTTPDIKWLGVRPSDLDRFKIPESCRIKMTDEDMKTGRRMVRFIRPSVKFSSKLNYYFFGYFSPKNVFFDMKNK